MYDQAEQTTVQEFVPLQRHQYPLWIKIFGLLALVVFLYTCIRFLWIELPYHRMAHKILVKAHCAFDNHQYYESITLYQSLLDQYPSFKEGKIKLAKSYFALCARDVSFDDELQQVSYYYVLGMNALGEEEYTKKEREELRRFLPYSYQKDFESSFTIT